MLNIGERFKRNYEKIFNYQLPYRLPIVIRVDGKNFHSFTKRMEMQRPFDEKFSFNMADLALYLCENTPTAQLAYVQSDEISILLHPYKRLDTDPYFANEVQKIASVTAATASAHFSLEYQEEAIFDARCFVLPEDEVTNYFIWRQQDATRNSVSALAQSLIPHKILHEKNSNQMQEMLWQKHGVNWNNLPVYLKRGLTVVKQDGAWMIDWEIPKFTENRAYINGLLEVEE